MSQEGPALPWAEQQAAEQDIDAVQGAHAATTASEADLQPVSIQQLGLEPGARIEVLWEVTMDEGDASSTWFPGSISCSSSSAMPAQEPAQDPPSTSTANSTQQQQQQQQEHRYTIIYDGSEEFPAETSTVLLLSEHELYDVARGAFMWWRREGEAYEPPDSDSEGEADEEEEAGALNDTDVSDVDVAAAEEAMMARLSGLAQSAAQKAHMMAGYKDLKDQFRAFLSAKASCAEGGDLLITTADVQEFMAMMNTQRKTGRGGMR